MRFGVIAQLIAMLAVARVSYGQLPAPQAARVERNVVYGMYSGLALLLDVYHPSEPNGIGVIYVGGSAWHARFDYDAKPLKDIPRLQEAVRPLMEAGYTVFVVNHRAASRFRYPAAVEDVQRAVRFVRHNAREYGIRPDRIGAAGHSSGASLALLLGLLDGTGDREVSDPINRESAKVQSVVALAPATDFIHVPASAVQSDYLGAVLLPPVDTLSTEYKIYREASPVSHVTADDAPCLLMHGDADELVPFRHSELMDAALSGAGVERALLPIKGGGHFPPYPSGGVDPFRETVQWFNKHLRTR